jgi:hypothetical protein
MDWEIVLSLYLTMQLCGPRVGSKTGALVVGSCVASRTIGLGGGVAPAGEVGRGDVESAAGPEEGLSDTMGF